MADHAFSTCNYEAGLPYPPVCVEAPSAAYACEMLSNMAGVVSKMSAVALYFYISLATKAQYGEISARFHHISIAEMHHLDIFAELVCLLGADPRLWSRQARKRWWSPSGLNYPYGICALISESIKSEEAAIRKYTRQADTICDAYITALLNRIILDEELHLATFEKMCRQLQ